MKEYLTFLRSNKETDSPLDLKIQNSISSLQKRDIFFLHLKIIILYIITGFISLSLCPQFGLNPFNRSPELIHMFMSYGTWTCGLFCGSVFMGVGAVLKFILLGRKDILLLRNIKLINMILMTAFIYGLFMFMGNKNSTSFINFSIVFFSSWLIGGIILDRIGSLLIAPYYQKKV